MQINGKNWQGRIRDWKLDRETFRIVGMTDPETRSTPVGISTSEIVRLYPTEGKLMAETQNSYYELVGEGKF